MARQKGFYLCIDQYKPIEDLTLEQKGQILDAMFAYHSGVATEITDPESRMAFKFFKQWFEQGSQKKPVSPAGKEARQANNRFTIPTVEEVNGFCRERNNSISGQAFYDFYASRGWCIGKQPMRDWKAAVRTWENKRKEELASRAQANGPDDMEAAMERVRQRNERLKAAERGEVA